MVKDLALPRQMINEENTAKMIVILFPTSELRIRQVKEFSEADTIFRSIFKENNSA